MEAPEESADDRNNDDYDNCDAGQLFPWIATTVLLPTAYDAVPITIFFLLVIFPFKRRQVRNGLEDDRRGRDRSVAWGEGGG